MTWNAHHFDFFFSFCDLFFLGCLSCLVLYRHLNKTVGCVNDFITYCLIPELRKPYHDMISGTLVLIDKLCTAQSSFRISKHVLFLSSCLDSMSVDRFSPKKRTGNVISTYLLPLLSMETEYLKHAECFHAYTEDYNKCNLEYHENEKKRGQSNGTTLMHLQLWCW